MLNILNFGVNPVDIPLSIRSSFYIHDDMLLGLGSESLDESLVSVSDLGVKVEPFWEDAPLLSGDPELDDVIMSESQLLLKHKQAEPTFTVSVRSSVGQKLQVAHEYFAQRGYTLVVKIGYRPLSVQAKLYDGVEKYYQQKYPDKTSDQIREMTMQMVAHPIDTTPPHSTGGAVDVLLRHTDTGKEVDMGSPINMPDESSHLLLPSTGTQHYANRLLLLNGMISAGFANLASEWWHFSYGDPYWALFYGHESSLYDSVLEKDNYLS